MAVFLSLLFRDWKVSLTLFFWAATTTFTRLYLGVHYLGDVTVGFFVGCTIGIIFYLLFILMKEKMKIDRKRFISEQFTSSGYMKTDMNLFLSIVFFNYLLIILIAMMLGIDQNDELCEIGISLSCNRGLGISLFIFISYLCTSYKQILILL